jgi:hypothetical protein
MRFPQAGRRSWTPAFVLALALVAAAPSAWAQGELDKTPWATGMVYPVGDPKDFQQPAPGESKGFSISRGLKYGRHRHEGVDLSNREKGGEVRAIAPGLVVCTRTKHSGGWGNMVVLAHRLPGGEVLFSLFAHLLPGSIAVREGDVVALGQPVGKIGSTGRSTGPHLHLEFRTLQGSIEKLGEPLARAWEKAAVVDPLRFFPSMIPGGTAPGAPPAIASTSPGAGAPSPAVAAASIASGRPDLALTRGELYRFALARLAEPGSKLPQRWSDVRKRLPQAAQGLSDDDRALFAASALPKREADARGPAGLSEVVSVCTAIARSLPPLGGPDQGEAFDLRRERHELEAVFPHALPAMEPGTNVVAAPAWRREPIGPPAVSRRQAIALWSYLEGSSLARRAPAASASAAGLP